MLKLLFVVIFLLNVPVIVPFISDKRLCANQNCSELISLAKTLIRYSSPDERILSFAPNEEVKVFSKSAGSNMDLWGVEINGRRGYVNKKLLRETKVLKKDFPFLVDTELINKMHDDKEIPLDMKESEHIEPNVQEQYEVIDGARINLSTEDIIEASSVRDSVQSNITPQLSSEEISDLNSNEMLAAINVKKEIRTLDSIPVSKESANELEENNFPAITNLEEMNKNDIAENSDLKNVENVEVINNKETFQNCIDDDTDCIHNKTDSSEIDEMKEQDIQSAQDSMTKDEVIISVKKIELNNMLSHDDNNKESNVRNIDSFIQYESLSDIIKSRNLLNVANEDLNIQKPEKETTIPDLTKLKIESHENINSQDMTITETDKIISNNAESEASINMNVEVKEWRVTDENVITYESSDSIASVPENLDDSLNSVESINVIDDFDKSVTNSTEIHEETENTITPPEDLVQQYSYSSEADTNATANLIETVDLNDTSNSFTDQQIVNHQIADQEKNKDEASEADANTTANLIEIVDLNDTSNSFTDQQIVNHEIADQEKNKDEAVEIDGTVNNILSDNEKLNSKNSNLFVDINNESKNETTFVSEQNSLEITAHDERVASSQSESNEVEAGESVLLSKSSSGFESCPADKTDCISDVSYKDVDEHNEEMKYIENPVDTTIDSNIVNFLIFMGITATSVVLFLLGYVMIDKCRKEAPLIAKINQLEKLLLIGKKENELLIERINEFQNEEMQDLISNKTNDKLALELQELLVSKRVLEEQVQSLEKELENSTEVGLELNRMLSVILSSQNGSDTLTANIEQLQRQLIEQQSTINSINAALNLKDTENHELQLELEINNKKVLDLQNELDKMTLNILKTEDEKEQLQNKLNGDIMLLRDDLEKAKFNYNIERKTLMEENILLKNNYSDLQRNLELKENEYISLKEIVGQIKRLKNDPELLKSLLDVSSFKGQLQHFQKDNQTLNNLLHQEKQAKHTFEKRAEETLQEMQRLKGQYDDVDKKMLEAQTKLEVLSSYFRDREAELQKELHKQESMWIEKQGEATSTTERIKYIQEELQNCKMQNESLKQEIISQEVELKSQISVLEKKAHENWVSARQAERKLEDARQEAMQLRNRLTLKERSFIEEKVQKRIQSPLEQNGDLSTGPLHLPIESSTSPPLLYGTREELTKSPPIPSLPPFLPPPPGIHFMPGFMPPPMPSMFTDHRPPPLGRMSSPQHNSRYSTDSRYLPYDRNSPPFEDYGASPPPLLLRDCSPYDNRNDRKDYNRPRPSKNSNKYEGGVSSDSGNSNGSLEKINQHHSKV